MSTTAMPELTVYYDGLCVICSKEIDMYRRWDASSQKITFVDIMAPDFDAAAAGLNPEAVHKAFHVRRGSGELLVGVEGFVAIWDTLGRFRPLAWFSRSLPGRLAMNAGYEVFCRLRPYLPRKEACDDGYCAR